MRVPPWGALPSRLGRVRMRSCMPDCVSASPRRESRFLFLHFLVSLSPPLGWESVVGVVPLQSSCDLLQRGCFEGPRSPTINPPRHSMAIAVKKWGLRLSQFQKQPLHSVIPNLWQCEEMLIDASPTVTT